MTNTWKWHLALQNLKTTGRLGRPVCFNWPRWLIYSLQAQLALKSLLPTQENDIKPLVDSVVRILNAAPPPLATLLPGTPHKPGIEISEPILYPDTYETRTL